MKKLLLTLAVVFCTVSAANAQVSGNTIGLRLGYGAELSYQHALSDASRLELNLGLSSLNFNYLSLNVSGIYQTVYAIDGVQGLNWYWGVGAALGVYSKSFQVGVLGDLGIEYNFPQIPLSLSLDWRPGLYFVTGGYGLYFGWEGICLGVRYRF